MLPSVSSVVAATLASGAQQKPSEVLNQLLSPDSEFHSGIINVGYKTNHRGEVDEIVLRGVKLPGKIASQETVSITLATTRSGAVNLNIGGLNQDTLNTISNINITLTNIADSRTHTVGFRKPESWEGHKDLAKAGFQNIPKGTYKISFS